MHISISWFGILFVTLIFLSIGVAVIKLLSILGNAILGRKPEVPVPVQKVNTQAAPRKGFPFLIVFGIAAVVTLLSIRANVRVDSSSTFSESVRIPSASREIDPEVQRAISEAAQTIRQDLASANGDVERGLRDAFNEIDEARKQVRSALRDATGTVPTVNLSTGTGPSSGSRTDDFLVMKISPAALAELIGERRSEVLKALRARLPDQQKHTFALIQLSAPVAENAAPGITPLIVAERLTNLAVSFADIVDEEKKQSENVAVAAAPAETPAETPTDTTVADSTPPAVEPATPETPVAPAAPSTDAAATNPAPGTEAAATDAAAATQTTVTETVAAAEPETATPAGPPAWLKETPPGKLHVKTSFFPEDETGEQELQEVIRKSIQDELSAMDSKYLRPEFLQHLLAIRVDDQVVNACVAGELKYEEQEPVTTGAGTLTMKRIHALVSIPESVRQNAQQQVEAAIRQNRADVLALSMGMVWCAVVTGAVGVKMGRKSRAMRYLVSAPLVLLLGIPLLTGAIGVVTASATGQYVSVPWNNGPIVVQVSEVPAESTAH